MWLWLWLWLCYIVCICTANTLSLSLYVSIVPLYVCVFVFVCVKRHFIYSFRSLVSSHSLARLFAHSFICSHLACLRLIPELQIYIFLSSLFYFGVLFLEYISKYANAVTLIFISTAQSSLQCGTHTRRDCVCVCVWERERERKRETGSEWDFHNNIILWPFDLLLLPFSSILYFVCSLSASVFVCVCVSFNFKTLYDLHV